MSRYLPIPDTYPANLCELPRKIQKAIQLDKDYWHFVVTFYNDNNREDIQAWLNSQTDVKYRREMLRRFNILDKKYNKQRKYSTQRMREGIRDTKRKQWRKCEEERLYTES